MNDYFELDKNRLDQEWVSHVRLYREHADKLNEARTQLEREKANVELVEAEIDRDIRQHPTNYGFDGGKPPESAIKQTIIIQPRYRKALEDFHRARHAAGIYQVAVDTMDHRKKALENLVSLRLADYFAEPHASQADKENVRRMERDTVFASGKKKR